MNFETESESVPLTDEQEDQLRQLAINRSQAALDAMNKASTEEELFYSLRAAAFGAIHLEQYDVAGELASKLLELSTSFTANWNYGNALHAGHTVLGLVALEDGYVECALAHLSKSGETPGSPQLNSFGPTMQLAKALVKHGETVAVLAYLQQCRNFWKSGTAWLDIWEQKIKSGIVPNFTMRSYG